MTSIRGKKLSLILVFGLSACGGELDGRWLVDKEASTESCLAATGMETSGNSSDYGRDPQMPQMMDGVAQQMVDGIARMFCEGLASNVAPQIDIDGSKMVITTLIGELAEVECSINDETNEFDCAKTDGKGQSGSIRVVEGNLIWELPPQPEKPSFSLTYNRAVKDG
jgi:hypothetical protein